MNKLLKKNKWIIFLITIKEISAKLEMHIDQCKLLYSDRTKEYSNDWINRVTCNFNPIHWIHVTSHIKRRSVHFALLNSSTASLFYKIAALRISVKVHLILTPFCKYSYILNRVILSKLHFKVILFTFTVSGHWKVLIL